MKTTFLTESGKEVDIEWLLGQPGVNISRPGNVSLECSSAGDKRFSAFYAKVSVYGEYKSIEEHYQMSKLFSVIDEHGRIMVDKNDEPILKVASDMKYAKGRTPEGLTIGNLVLPPVFLTPWYTLLWMKYLNENPDLVRYLGNFDIFTDKFDKRSINSQAHVIRNYMKRRDLQREETEVLYNILKQQQKVEEQYAKEHADEFSSN